MDHDINNQVQALKVECLIQVCQVQWVWVHQECQVSTMEECRME